MEGAKGDIPSLHLLYGLTTVIASPVGEEILLRRGLEILLQALGEGCGEAYRLRRGELEAVHKVHPHRGSCALDSGLAQKALGARDLLWQGSTLALPLGVGEEVRGVYLLGRSRPLGPRERELLALAGAWLGLGLRYKGEQGREAQRKGFLHQLLFAQEEERRRVGRELHDVVGSQLTGALLALQLAETHPGYLKEARQAVAQALEEVRRLSRELRPALLDEMGLVKALETYLKEYRERTGLKVEWELECPPLREVQQIAIFRVIQEALTNVARHAQARRVYVGLSAWDQKVHGLVADDGIGFDPDQVRASVGLAGMRERVEWLGGQLTLESWPGQGTRVRFEVPL